MKLMADSLKGHDLVCQFSFKFDEATRIGLNVDDYPEGIMDLSPGLLAQRATLGRLRPL